MAAATLALERTAVGVVLRVVLLVVLAGFDLAPPGGLFGVPVDGGFQPIPEAPLRLPAELEQFLRVDPVPPIVRWTVDDVLDQRLGLAQQLQNAARKGQIDR